MSTKKSKIFTGIKYLGIYISGCCLFTILLFPLNDLGDMVSGKIAQATNKKIFVFFEKMSLSFFPTLGVSVEDVSVEGASIPQIKAASAQFRPSILDLLKFQAGGSLDVTDIMGSDLSSSFTLDTPDDKGKTEHKLNFNIEGLNLKEVAGFSPVPLTIKGRLDGEGNFIVDQSFATQPTGEFSLGSKKAIKIESLNIPQVSLVFSDIEFSQFVAKGQMKDGEIVLDTITLGSPKNDISLQAKGSVNLEFTNNRGRVNQRIRRYNLKMRLIRSNRLLKKDAFIASSLDLALSAAKVFNQGPSKVYQFRVQGSGLGPPRIASLEQY